ncbi:MAG: hypothetical protein H9W81_04280 [Enterococcus sp.]|nr:hypothetical protein [Enterococcus sp.]
MISALITSGVTNHPPVQDQATIIHKVDRPDGTCLLTFDIDGDEAIIEETNITCPHFHEGDKVSY